MPRAPEPRPSGNQVAREIANLIVTGAWQEGSTLPREIELASQFAVSRTSIRESLSILKAKGLIAAVPVPLTLLGTFAEIGRAHV